MDWHATIGRHHAALRRVVAVLVAMVGAGPEAAAGRPTLARLRHRALLRLVRPAEAAVRRLVIVLALSCLAAPPAPRKARPLPVRKRRLHAPAQPRPTSAILRNGKGTGIVLPRPGPGSPPLPAWAEKKGAPAPPRKRRLPLADPERRPRVRRAASRSVPRICVPGLSEPFRPPPPPTPHDRLDATRLVLRVHALAETLDDLPGEARRFMRWRDRRAAERAEDLAFEASGGRTATPRETAAQARSRAARRLRRVSPLRSGRPPGGRRIPAHEIDSILNDVQGLAFDLVARLDTS